MYFAYQVFVKNPKRAERIAARFPTAHRLMLNKFYVDEIYDAAIIWPIERLSRSFLWKGIDIGIVDGAVNGVASLALRWSNRVKRLQSGYVRVYANWILFGAVLILLYYYFAS
jgi:NADH-quinone oxidoreductase subunit L